MALPVPALGAWPALLQTCRFPQHQKEQQGHPEPEGQLGLRPGTETPGLCHLDTATEGKFPATATDSS